MQPESKEKQRWQWLVLALLVVALRLPFFASALQGDDVNYLAGGMHALIEPLHPNHARYAFLGEMVEMQGHPHPPFNAWYLGGLLALVGDVDETRFHVAYLLFSLVAAWSALAIARRFTDKAFLAALLFCATIPFVVNGNSLESDLPLLAWWMAAVALFLVAVERRSGGWLGLCVLAQVLAIMTAYQAIVLTPILGLFLWQKARGWKPGWASLLTMPVVFVAWQLYERSVTGSAPTQVLAGYFSSYGLQRLENKLRNGLALTVHLAWLVFPVAAVMAFRLRWWCLVPAAALGLAWLDPNPLFWFSLGLGLSMLVAFGGLAWREQNWLAQWIVVFFLAALAIFFAGSARYLLPISMPVILLAVQRVERRWLWPAFIVQLSLAMLLAFSNAQHWDGVRDAMEQFGRHTKEKRLWINSELGLRFYAEEAGGLPVLRGQAIEPGQYVVQSQLAFPIPLSTGGGVLAPVESRTIQPTIPLRLFGLGSCSGYSTADVGLRPFDFVAGPADVVTLQAVTAKRPELSFLKMGAAEASSQIVSGIYELENNEWRWMSDRGVVLLKAPATAEKPQRLEAKIYIPDAAPGRHVTLSCDGTTLEDKVLPGPGLHTLTSAGCRPRGESALVVLTIDKLFRSETDQRRLGMIVASVGFVE